MKKHQATTPKATRVKGRLHLDKRAEAIIDAVPPEASDDDLLTTQEVAIWFGVSTDWLAIGRMRDYGPPFVKLAPQMIRYRRGDSREWLRQRQYASTADYTKASDGRTKAARLAKAEV